MSLDGIAIRALTNELTNLLLEGRIDKIQQPDANTLILTIRKPGKSFKLLLSNHPQTARFHLTQINKANPSHPPLFCMVLRKHLEGYKLQGIEQKGLERIVYFKFEGYDELGQKSHKILIGEFMGKHSNLTLINPETNLIIDSIKRINHSTSQYRQVLPGIPYVFPPPQNKLSLKDIYEEKLIEELLKISPEKKLVQGLLQTISGIGPQTAQELTIRAGLNIDLKIEFLGQYEYTKLFQQVIWLKNIIEKQNFNPTVVKNEQNPIAFAPFSLEKFPDLNQISFSSMSELIEYFIGKKENINHLKQKLGDLEKVVKKELDRCEKKLVLQLDKITEGIKAQKFKIWGELLTANLYQLKQGRKAEVINFFSQQQEILEIPLEPNLTPNENAQKYFKKYNKAKIGADKALEQSNRTREEIKYLESIKNSLDKADNLQEIQEIRWELEEAGYLKSKPTKNNRKPKSSVPIKPLSLDIIGFKILIGKNNKQNDYVTLKLAKNNDLWLHVKDIPGSHVIIKNPEQKEIPKKVLEIAAHFAAFFSKGRYSTQVPVDYTLKKNVRKPNGAKPGMVIYDNQKTIFITPNDNIIDEILKSPIS